VTSTRPEDVAARATHAPGGEEAAVGRSLPRREDDRLLTGRGRYLADHDAADLCHVAIGRSPVAHADLAGIDLGGAASAPGVVAVVSAAELAAAGARPLGHRLGPPTQPLSWGVLAEERVRYVGEPVVAVVATSRALAEDALELVEIDYRELPPVVGVDAALAPDAPLLYPQWGTNVLLHLEHVEPGVEQALAAAPHRLAERFENHRVVGLPLEARGVQASWDPGSGRLEVLSSCQQPHQLRSVLAEVCGLDEAAVRVRSPDVGGGFGNKQHFTREECLVALLARVTARTVRWSEDRTEALVSSVHARAQVHEVEAGFDDDGRLLALRVRVLSDLGDPVLYFSGVGPALVTVGSLAGGYDVASVAWSLSCVATSTAPVGAYRGFGQPEAHFSTERVMDRIAATLGRDPAEVRRVNLLPDRPRPFWGKGARRIDVGPLGAQLDLLLEEFGWQRWRQRRDAARADGRYVGLGLSTLVQGTSPNQHDTAGRFGSFEMAAVSVLPDGRVGVRVGTKSQGQGHETIFAQVAADALGVDPARVRVADGDTDALVYGQGTWGSRSAVMGGGALLVAAGRVRDKMARIAEALRLDWPGSGAVPAHSWERVAEVAWWYQHLLPAGVEPGLTEVAGYTPGFTDPRPDGSVNHDETYGSHMTAAAVEVDPATGAVSVLDALMVSDCGVVINPTLALGQLQGGFAQGLGVAFLEEVRYGPDGQPLCSTLLDYTIPTALDVPELRVVFRPTPAETAGGFRGLGEAGIIAAPAVLVGAAEDALAPLGVRLSSTRAHAGVLRTAIAAAGWPADAARFAR